MRILQVGYYGHDNLGDELLMECVSSSLRKEFGDVEIIKTTSKPGKTDVSRFSPLLVAELIRADLIVYGGGGLFNDYTLRSLLYYLSIGIMAKAFGKKVALFACGVGPLRSDTGRKLVANALRKFDVLTVRDTVSADLLLRLEPPVEAFVTADPVFLSGFSPSFLSDGALCFSKRGEEGAQNERKKITLILRPWRDIFAERAIFEFLSGLVSRYDYSISLLPLGGTEDHAFANSWLEKINRRDIVLHPCLLSPEDAVSIVAGSDAVVSMRLHGVILSMLAGRPVLGLSYDPKVKGLFVDAELEDCVFELDSAGVAGALKMLEKILAEPAEYERRIRQSAGMMARRARGTARLLSHFLNSGKGHESDRKADISL